MMQTSEKGINAIIAFEGMELDAYKCPSGVWTIGVGHTGYIDGRLVQKGMSISEDKAMTVLKEDLKKFEDYLNKQPFASRLNQNQFDALVSFVFNVGTGNFQNSTMRKKLCMNAKKEDIAAEFGRWVYGTANGKKTVLKGLEHRREKEAEMFLS